MNSFLKNWDWKVVTILKKSITQGTNCPTTIEDIDKKTISDLKSREFEDINHYMMVLGTIVAVQVYNLFAVQSQLNILEGNFEGASQILALQSTRISLQDTHFQLQERELRVPQFLFAPTCVPRYLLLIVGEFAQPEHSHSDHHVSQPDWGACGATLNRSKLH